MADGGLTITIDETLADSLRAAADASGMSVEDFARAALHYQVAWTNADAEEDLRIAEEALRTGDFMTLEEFEARMDTFGKPR